MAKIFISYRRADSKEISRRIYDSLAEHYGVSLVFRDNDTIPKGINFLQIIERYVLNSEVALVLIGPDWLEIKDEKTGKRRLDNPEDFVRLEIDLALRHVPKVIPVLLNGVSMPSETELPIRIAQLAYQNAVWVSDDTFDKDIQVLIDAIGLPSLRRTQRSRILFPLLVVGLLLIGIIAPSIFDPQAGENDATPFVDIDTTAAARLTAAVAEATLIAETYTPRPTATATRTNIPLSTPSVTATQTLTSTPDATLLAFRPQSNADWTPVERDFNGVTMVLVPAGCFDMGENGEGGRQCFDEAFWIGKYEVTNAEYAEFIDSGGYDNPVYWTEAGWLVKQSFTWSQPRYWLDHRFNNPNQPVVGVSWYEALAYATWRGMTLPTESQWEYTAKGPDGWAYPWGDAFVSNNFVYYENANDQPSAVGSRPDGVSWVGAVDIAGNVWEWSISEYRDYPYISGEEVETAGSASSMVLRGGSWDGAPGFARTTYRSQASTHYYFANQGFRICRPAS